MNTRLLPVLLAVASLTLAGCLPESKNPLSTPATSIVDSRLGGVYVQRREKKEDDLSTWHFHYRGVNGGPEGKSGTTPWLEVLNVEHVKNGGLKGNAYRALATHLGGHDYLSFVELGSGGGAKGKTSLYHFARYEVSFSGDLRVWFVNTHAVEDAIKAGKLHGQVTHHKYEDDVTLGDSTEHLAAFVAASDPAVLFSGKPAVFYRLAQ